MVGLFFAQNKALNGGMLTIRARNAEYTSDDPNPATKAKNSDIPERNSNPTTMKLAKMNLAIRGIACNMGQVEASTFTADQHPDLKASYILMNPPFNLKDWRNIDELLEAPRWKGYAVPATSNANYAWLLNAVSKLNQNGVCAILLAYGAIGSTDGPDYEIRKQLIENVLVEAIVILPRDMFYIISNLYTVENSHGIRYELAA